MLGEGAVSLLLRTQSITATPKSVSEYVALAEIVNKLRFLWQMKAFMVPPIDYNIRVHEDNEGATKMAENILAPDEQDISTSSTIWFVMPSMGE